MGSVEKALFIVFAMGIIAGGLFGLAESFDIDFLYNCAGTLQLLAIPCFIYGEVKSKRKIAVKIFSIILGWPFIIILFGIGMNLVGTIPYCISLLN